MDDDDDDNDPGLICVSAMPLSYNLQMIKLSKHWFSSQNKNEKANSSKITKAQTKSERKKTTNEIKKKNQTKISTVNSETC